MTIRHSLSLVLGLILTAAAALKAQGMDVFATFEDFAQVDSVKTTPGVEVRQSSRFPLWGENSLQTDYPVSGGRIEVTDIPRDWRGQEALLAFAWSEQPAELELSLCDAAGNSYSKTFALRTGANHIQLKLERAEALELSRMRSIALASKHPGRFYLDYFALDRFHPVLEERGRWDFDYTMKVETPHVAWARPFNGGPLKVYSLCGVIDGRSIIELAQRLELNFKAATLGIRPGTNMYGFGDFYEQRRGPSSGYSLAYTYIADDLLNGPDYDVILWPALRPWEEFPKEVRENVRKRVEAGAGLVFFYPLSRKPEGDDLWDISPIVRPVSNVNIWPEDSVEVDSAKIDKRPWKPSTTHYISRGVPFEAFPKGHLTALASAAAGQVLIETTSGTPVLAVRTLGKGRVAAFGYSERGMIPEVSNVWETGLNYQYQDYLWSVVARAVVWTAGREPKAAIEKSALAGNKIAITLAAVPPNAQLTVKFSSEFGEAEGESSLSLKEGNQALFVLLPDNLPGGRHFADLQLKSGQACIDWATVVIDRDKRATIRSLELVSDRVTAGEPVQGKVRVSASAKESAAVTVRLLDNYGRLLTEKTLAATGAESELPFDLSSAGALTHLVKIDCAVSVAGVCQDRRISEVFVLQKRVWDDYDIVMYLFGPSPIPGTWPTIDSQMQKLNITTLSSYPIDLCKHANYQVQAQTRISGQESPDNGPDRIYYDQMKKQFVATRDKSLLVRKYCLNDPAYKEKIRMELKNLATPWVPFSPLSYYVYEEPSFTCYGDALDICFSEHCMSALREWLKEKYGTLEALNRQWGTTFSGWEAVIPDDTYEAQARGNYASWADHRTFMEKTYAGCYKYVLDELRKLDPQGILLNSGTQESYPHNGCDYSQMNLYTGHLNAYQYDLHRSMNPDIKISGGAGYGVYGKSVFYNFYQNLFKGCNGGLYVFWQYCTLDPDLTLNHSAQDMVPGFQELRGEGIGKLVGLAKPDNHGIAIHYSYPSIHGAWIVDGVILDHVSYNTSPTFQRFNSNLEGWMEGLRDAGLQFDFLAYSALENGELISRGYKTLILPMSVALSDKEVEAIREFVKEGGNVIADALPGVMDEHCTFRKTRPLDDIFGVQSAPGTREALIAMSGEPGLKAKSAVSLEQGKSPLKLLENRYGSGKACLLNFFLDRYQADKRESRAAETLKDLKTALADAGVAPKVQLTSLSGEPVTDCERYLFNNGTTALLGLVPALDLPQAQKVRITLPRRAAIFDVRNKAYLGTDSAFESELEPGAPQLFSMVAGRISAVALEAPRSAALGGAVNVGIKVEGPQDLRSVAKVLVTDPAGRQLRYYGGNRDIVSGAGSFSFSTALNDPKGAWVLEVTEVMSGERARAVIDIQ